MTVLRQEGIPLFLETLRALCTDTRATEYHQRDTMKLYDRLIYASWASFCPTREGQRPNKLKWHTKKGGEGGGDWIGSCSRNLSVHYISSRSHEEAWHRGTVRRVLPTLFDWTDHCSCSFFLTPIPLAWTHGLFFVVVFFFTSCLNADLMQFGDNILKPPTPRVWSPGVKDTLQCWPDIVISEQTAWRQGRNQKEGGGCWWWFRREKELVQIVIMS